MTTATDETTRRPARTHKARIEAQNRADGLTTPDAVRHRNNARTKIRNAARKLERRARAERLLGNGGAA